MDIPQPYRIQPEAAIAGLIDVRDLRLTITSAAGQVHILAGVDLRVDLQHVDRGRVPPLSGESLAAGLIGEAERRDLVVGALAADRGRKGGEAEAESENDRQEAHQSLQDRPTSIMAP